MKKIVRKNLEIEDRFQIIFLLEQMKKIDLDYVIVKTFIISNNISKVGFIYKNNNKLKLIKNKKIIYNFLEIISQNFDKFLVVSESLLNFTYNDYDIFVNKTFHLNDLVINYYNYNWFVIFEKER